MEDCIFPYAISLSSEEKKITFRNILENLNWQIVKSDLRNIIIFFITLQNIRYLFSILRITSFGIVLFWLFQIDFTRFSPVRNQKV